MSYRIRRRIVLSGVSEEQARAFAERRDCLIGYDALSLSWTVVQFVYGR